VTTTYAVRAPDWRALAACRGADPDDFFPDGQDDAPATAAQVAAAKQVCAACFVRRECLDYAVSTRQREGIWGGTTEGERHRERRRSLRRGRKAA
jgi:WhiB family transcriptional regulator, redox-sensing transcriptional regulator